MALTRDFRETIMERAARDAKFRRGLLTEAVNEILEGNLDAGKAMLRDYINATITFPTLAEKLNKDSKSIHRMLGPKGNPRMDSIVGILKVLQDQEHIKLRAKA
ncbi:MAG: transcriptional regulator [Nitrospirota bacterium]